MHELGYLPPTTYEKAVPDTIERVVAATSGRDWRTAIRDSAHLEPMFDYLAEDAYLAGLQTP